MENTLEFDGRLSYLFKSCIVGDEVFVERNLAVRANRVVFKHDIVLDE